MIDTPPGRPPSAAPARREPLAPTRDDEARLALVEIGVPLVISGLLVTGLLVGLLALLIVQPATFDAMATALSGPKTAWYLTRSSAFVSYGFLWLSMALGLAITNRMARAWPGGPTVTDLHEHASLLGLLFGVLHALALLGDHYIGYTLSQILIPFTNSEYRPLWVGFGQIGFYLAVLVTVTFYMRRWLGARIWRTIHYLSFVSFVLALAHGIWSGSDSGAGWASNIYLFSGVSLLALTGYRILVASRRRATPRPNAGDQRSAR
jgi:predicted ferric reductase